MMLFLMRITFRSLGSTQQERAALPRWRQGANQDVERARTRLAERPPRVLQARAQDGRVARPVLRIWGVSFAPSSFPSGASPLCSGAAPPSARAARRQLLRPRPPTARSEPPAVPLQRPLTCLPTPAQTTRLWRFHNTRLFRLRDWLRRSFGIGLPLFHGLGLLPFSVRVQTYCGEPIEVARTRNPTDEQVEALHRVYVRRLVDVFERHKRECGYGDMQLDVL